MSKTNLKKERAAAVLKSMRDGSSLLGACTAARVKTASFWAWMEADPKLKAAYFGIKRSRIGMVEDALYKNAMEGNVIAQIFFLKNRAPIDWRDRKETEVTHQVSIIDLIKTDTGGAVKKAYGKRYGATVEKKEPRAITDGKDKELNVVEGKAV